MDIFAPGLSRLGRRHAFHALVKQLLLVTLLGGIGFFGAMLVMPRFTTAAEDAQTAPTQGAQNKERPLATKRSTKAAVPLGEDALEQFPLPIVLQWNREQPWRVEGRVVNKAGDVVRDANVALIAELYTMDVPRMAPQVLGHTRTDAAGKFRIQSPSLDYNQCRALSVVASTPDHAMSSVELDVPLLDHPPIEFRLEPADAVQGRLVDLTGKPAAGVTLSVRSISETGASTRYTSSVSCWPTRAQPVAWPVPVITDEEGRFTLRCMRLQPDAKVGITVEIDDPRYAPATFFSIIDSTHPELELKCETSGIVKGMVTCQDSGKPMENTWLIVVSNPHNFSRGADTQLSGVHVQTDGEGRFTTRVKHGKFVTVFVYPSAGQPYPAWMDQKPWPDEAKQDPIRIEVPRGVLVHGRVIDEEARSDVADVGVEYQPHFEFTNPRFPGRNPYVSNEVCRQVYWAAERRRVLTDRDGRFQIAVLPGKGYLMAKAPTPDYVSQFITTGELQWGKRVGFYHGLEGIATLNPKPESQPLNQEISVRRGKSLSGTVVGPRGERVEKAILLKASYSPLSIINPISYPQPVRAGLWQVRGYDLASPRLISIFDQKNEWGTAVKFSADTPPREQEIRLQPCGTATVTLVDENKHPWATQPLNGSDQPLAILMVEGQAAAPHDDHILSGFPDDIGWEMAELAPQQYKTLRTDKMGRVTLPCLIPGARYKLFSFALGDGRQLWREQKAFQVEPGENADLGVVVAKRSK